ncbi:MAG: hypothetical protein SFV20_01985 [Sphingopyxis sp.]|nr:hypothetical protein [Sphingopyxis sp.]
MNAIQYALAVASLSVTTSSASAWTPASCPLANIESQRELHELLSLRAVEIVKLAMSGDRERLAEWVTPSASFNLGAGDVGRPLGTGIQGAETLAATMNADTYRYLGWDYMDGPAMPCASQKVAVEFVDSQSKSMSQVQFTFVGGRLADAIGWQRSFKGDSLIAANPIQ